MDRVASSIVLCIAYLAWGVEVLVDKWDSLIDKAEVWVGKHRA
jgi:hypothetical protein